MFNYQQPSYTGGYGFGIQQQSQTVKDVDDFFKDLEAYSSYLGQAQVQSQKDLNITNERMENSAKAFKESCTQKQPQKAKPQQIDAQPDKRTPVSMTGPVQADPASLCDWVDTSVKTSITERLKKTTENNKEIFETLLTVHQLMEQYSGQLKKISKNSGKELQLLNDLEVLRDTIQSQSNKLAEVSNRFEYRQSNPRLTQLRKNTRVKEFDLQSQELMNKVKNDYFHSRILLDKSQEQIEQIKKTLEDGK